MDEKHNHRLHNTEEKTASGRIGTGFGVREMITISVGLPGKHLYPDKRYHDWLRPATS